MQTTVERIKNIYQQNDKPEEGKKLNRALDYDTIIERIEERARNNQGSFMFNTIGVKEEHLKSCVENLRKDGFEVIVEDNLVIVTGWGN